MQKFLIFFIFVAITYCENNAKEHLIKVLKSIKNKAVNKIEFNCPVPSNDEDGRIEIGKTIRICIHLLPLNFKTIFTLKADEKQVISLQNSYFTTGFLNTDYLIQFQNSDIFSNLIPYVRTVKNNINYAYPFAAVVINVQDGKIVQIDVESQDEACQDHQYPKPTNLFADRFGYYRKAFCPVRCPYFDVNAKDEKYIEPQENFTYKQNCDFRIVVTWQGTDKNKKPFMSGMRKFTAFKQFDLSQRLKGYLALNQYKSDLDLNQLYIDNLNQIDVEIAEKRRQKVDNVRKDKVEEQELEDKKSEIQIKRQKIQQTFFKPFFFKIKIYFKNKNFQILFLNNQLIMQNHIDAGSQLLLCSKLFYVAKISLTYQMAQLISKQLHGSLFCGLSISTL